MNINEMSIRDLCFKWKPYAQDLGRAVKTYLADRGEVKVGRWEYVLKVNPDLAVALGIDLSQPLEKPVASALSFFYAYHVTGERKERDAKRRAKDRQSTPEQRAMWREQKREERSRRSTPEQRAAWREQKRESNARLAEGIRRKAVHTRIKPIVARREDMNLPALEDTSSNGQGLRGSVLRVIEQLQSLLKAIE